MTDQKKKKGNGFLDTEDLMTAGFERLETPIKKVKVIKWGILYKQKTDKQKIEYLEQLASSMNHAAYVIQNERNTLGQLVELKERQLHGAKAAIDQNNKMIQQQVTAWNADKKKMLTEIAQLRAQIRELTPKVKAKIPESWEQHRKDSRDGDHN